jgi:peptidoglycan hydrolase CwlO-like protein
MNAIQNIVEEFTITSGHVSEVVNDVQKQNKSIHHISEFSTDIDTHIHRLADLLRNINSLMNNIRSTAAKNTETSRTITDALMSSTDNKPNL